MTHRWVRRALVGLIFALPPAMISVSLAHGSPANPGSAAQALNCAACHSAFQTTWETGAHGQAATDPVFLQEWQARGEPKECLACHTTGYDPVSKTYQTAGVTCQACHSPAPGNHPTEPMPVDRSAGLCGSCHTETLFAWQVSKHGEVGVECHSCHDPHATSIKAKDSSSLCASCHGTRAASFSHSVHHEEGLLCADCHLEPVSGDLAEGHAKRDHTFRVDLSVCNDCHAYELHGLADQPATPPTAAALDAMAATETAQVSAEPAPVSPVFFTMLSGLIGMATGMILAPWLERWYRRMRSDEG